MSYSRKFFVLGAVVVSTCIVSDLWIYLTLPLAVAIGVLTARSERSSMSEDAILYQLFATAMVFTPVTAGIMVGVRLPFGGSTLFPLRVGQGILTTFVLFAIALLVYLWQVGPDVEAESEGT